MTFIRLVCLLLVVWSAPASIRATEPIEVSLWKGDALDPQSAKSKEKWEERGKNGVVDRAVRQVDRPTITAYLPAPAKANGVGILIAPGGGYEHLAIDNEGHDVARWFAAEGFAGFVLKYRLPKTPQRNYTVATALADAAEALKIIRAHADEWHVDPAKVGMIGFSAGGNLAARAGTQFALDTRPAFLGLIYPGIPADFGLVPSDVPPTFLAAAVDDRTGAENSVRFYEWVCAQKRPVELHIFSRGAHGFGMKKTGLPAANWPRLFADWLVAAGLVSAR